MTNTEKKKLFQARNNILLSILLVAKQNQLFERISLSKKKNNTNLYNKPIKSSKFKFNNTVQTILNDNNNSNNNNKDETIFQNLNFLNNIADNIKKLLIDENSVECVSSNISSPLVRKHFSENKLNKTNSNEDFDYDYEVELFFLALLDYKDKARVIKQKNIYYFNNFIDDLNLPNKFNLDKIINEISIYRDISQLNPSELIFLRKILSNSAKRKLYHGIEFFTCSSTLNIYLSEGRIWKNIGLFFKSKNLFDLWIKYEKRIEKEKYLRQTQTILMEYGKKLTFLNNELILLNQEKEKDIYKINKNAFLNKEIKKKCKLPFVTSFKDLISIFLKYDLKELTLYCIEEYYINSKLKKVPLEIFNLCLDYDQDLSIELFDKSLNQLNVTESYMLAALIKKYFRFARCLLKFKKCKNFLNSPPPE